MVALVRHSQWKQGATDRPDLTPPRQSSTLHPLDSVDTRSFVGAHSSEYALLDYSSATFKSAEMHHVGIAHAVSFAWLKNSEPLYGYLRGRAAVGTDPMGLCTPSVPSQVCDRANKGTRITTSCVEECCLEYGLLWGAGGPFYLRFGCIDCIRWGGRFRTRGWVCSTAKTMGMYVEYLWFGDFFSHAGQCFEGVGVAGL